MTLDTASKSIIQHTYVSYRIPERSEVPGNTRRQINTPPVGPKRANGGAMNYGFAKLWSIYFHAADVTLPIDRRLHFLLVENIYVSISFIHDSAYSRTATKVVTAVGCDAYYTAGGCTCIRNRATVNRCPLLAVTGAFRYPPGGRREGRKEGRKMNPRHSRVFCW